MTRRNPGGTTEASVWSRYDLVKELVIALVVVGVLVVVLPPPSRHPTSPGDDRDLVTSDPVDFVTTATNELAGTTSAGYGPPYNSAGAGQAGDRSRRRLVWGRIPIDSANAFVIQPLARAASATRT